MRLTSKLAKVGASLLAVLVVVTVFSAVQPQVELNRSGADDR